MKLENFKKTLPEPNEDWPEEIKDLIKSLNNYIFDERLTVEWIKMRLGIRQARINGKLRYYTHIDGIRKYITIQRMQASLQILTINGAMIADIAFALGYRRENSFSTTFSRYFGCSPENYRTKIRDNI